jgi:hypothetical protein
MSSDSATYKSRSVLRGNLSGRPVTDLEAGLLLIQPLLNHLSDGCHTPKPLHAGDLRHSDVNGLRLVVAITHISLRLQLILGYSAIMSFQAAIRL